MNGRGFLTLKLNDLVKKNQELCKSGIHQMMGGKRKPPVLRRLSRANSYSNDASPPPVPANEKCVHFVVLAVSAKLVWISISV